MYIVAQHSIRDLQKTMEAGQSLFTPPPGYTLHLFLPNAEGGKAICLWEAESVEAVRELVDGAIGAYSDNQYFAVDEDAAVGLQTITAGTVGD
ncbi:MAG TPA: hypothetical protein VGR22_11105 [Thermomicrobiales bacterium]|nr:hypothetical protein [Thermomicrobiales bacterium]